MLKTIELFCGTKSFSSVMKRNCHETYTVDNDRFFEPDLCMDMRQVDISDRDCDLLWASPPCQGFSVAVIGRNWNKDYTPKTDSARLSVALVERTIEMIKEIKPTIWFIENPRGMLRKLPVAKAIEGMGGVRRTVSYCQYGDTRQKPTDIWSNATWWKPKPICKPGSKCHEVAPRGSRTGTQGLKDAKERGRIPSALFEEILSQMPK